jgi:phage recombination protein Bet
MNEVALTNQDFTKEQLDLIKNTVAKTATNEELGLFLYRCKNMGLDPLKPGQVHFIKYGSNPGTIVVGIDGFRSRAARTGKLVGIKRGVIRDDSGRCVGAWCEVYRSDWHHPAREEVSLSEYNSGRGQWSKMPETMIKKVAEASALRMAFADDLGGLYSDDEMEQVQLREVSSSGQTARAQAVISSHEPEMIEIEEPDLDECLHEAKDEDVGEYLIPIGKQLKGKRLKDVSPDRLKTYVDWVEKNITMKNEATKEFLFFAEKFLAE